MDLLDNKYRIEHLLGEGGMGAVYRATHLGTKRIVAVKIIHPQLSKSDEFIARFRREAEAAGRLRHPNVVDVTDFGLAQTESGPVAYLVMEYLDGCTLAEVLNEERRLPIPWVVDILEQVCSAVDEAHRLGIIHRDLKPDNIWLEPNRRGGYTIKVLDFGLVKLGAADSAESAIDEKTNQSAGDQFRADSKPPQGESPTLLQPLGGLEEDTILKGVSAESAPESAAAGQVHGGSSSKIDSNGRLRREIFATGDQSSGLETGSVNYLTRVGSVMGTPAYMSPEQCRGDQLDARSDIYSLGVVAYRMLAGHTPFSGTLDESLRQHQTTAPPPLREQNRKVSRRMARVVMRALEKDPRQRSQTAAGFGSALRASLESSGQLLRQAIALYSEHLPSFLKISLIGYAPLVAVLVFAQVSDRLLHFDQLSPLGQSAFGLTLFLSMIVANIMAYFLVSAATVPVVIQLMVAPLRPVRLKIALLTLKRRWLTLTIVSLLVLGMILFGTLLLFIPGVLAAIYYSLYAPVLIVEGAGVRVTLKRTRKLVSRERLGALVITLLQFALPLLVWHAAVTTHFTLKLDDNWGPREIGFNFSMSGRSAAYQLLNIFVTPLTAIMLSLLYLKTRRAGGESLKDLTEQIEMFHITRSRWQARMRSRSSSLMSNEK